MTLERYAEILTRTSILHLAERERGALRRLHQARDASTAGRTTPRRRRRTPLRAS